MHHAYARRYTHEQHTDANQSKVYSVRHQNLYTSTLSCNTFWRICSTWQFLKVCQLLGLCCRLLSCHKKKLKKLHKMRSKREREMHKNLLRFIMPHAKGRLRAALAAATSQDSSCNCISVCLAAYAKLFMPQMWLAACLFGGAEHLSALKYATHFFYATFLTLVVARSPLICCCAVLTGIMKISGRNTYTWLPE